MIVKEIWSRLRLILRVQLQVRLTLKDSKRINVSWSEARRTVPIPVTYWSQTRHDQCQSGHDQLLFDGRVDKFKLAFEVDNGTSFERHSRKPT